MSDKKFYIQKATRSTDGTWALGDKKSLEDDFGYCRYMSLSNANSRGKQKGLYSETYAESDAVSVWFAESASREQISISLSVAFFGSDPQVTDNEGDIATLIQTATTSWQSFCDWLEGGLVIWYDDYRQRYLLMYLQEAVSPESDVIKNTPYINCKLTFTSVFGKSFDSDTEIKQYLNIK